MPLKVHVHALEIRTLPLGNFHVWGDVLPIPVPFSSPIEYDPVTLAHFAKSPIELSAGSRYSSTLRIHIKSGSDAFGTTVASVSLPLSWFPVDQTVVDWFPLRASAALQYGVFAQLRVHVVKRFDLPPFTAPLGTLLVLPAWNRPGRPAIPPTPFFWPVPPGYSAMTVHQGPYPGSPQPGVVYPPPPGPIFPPPPAPWDGGAAGGPPIPSAAYPPPPAGQQPGAVYAPPPPRKPEGGRSPTPGQGGPPTQRTRPSQSAEGPTPMYPPPLTPSPQTEKGQTRGGSGEPDYPDLSEFDWGTEKLPPK
jgi:hypothetical protein